MILSGGVLVNNSLVKRKFLSGVRTKYRDIFHVDPKHDPAYGAALIAQNFNNGKEAAE